MSGETRILARSDVADLLPLGECVTAVESAFRLHAEGKSLGPGVLSVHAHGGAFHIKAAGLELGRSYFATKTNGNFFGNAERGLPRIQGTIVLCDAEDGSPLAVLDSIEVTIRRTGAATAVAAKYLSRKDASTLAIIGCGNQGRVSVEALRAVRPIERVLAYDENPAAARSLAASLPGIDAKAVPSLAEAVAKSDLCVTCTPAKKAFLFREHLHPGLFVAAVGADSSEKQEIDPLALASARVYVDQLEQAMTIGDLQHAIKAGVMRESDVVAELSDVVAGTRAGRRNDDEAIIFDSTGTALQDVAAAAIVYERATVSKRGVVVRLNS